jgi:hypothetical protein
MGETGGMKFGPERTNATYEHRISRVLDVAVEGRPLADWRLQAGPF